MSARWRDLLLVAVLLTGCVYYNAMWSAERLAKQARRAEARGRAAEARAHWMQAASKAESVHVRHPDSRWADDAWVLHAEGLARAGLCKQARPTIASALAEAVTTELRERVALVAGECTLELGVPNLAVEYLAPALASRHAGRRSRAAWLAGRAAEGLGDASGAVVWYGQSSERAAGPARARVLLSAGQIPSGVATLDTVLAARLDEPTWAWLLDSAAAAAGPAAASAALDRGLARQRAPGDVRARLLLADGDRRFGAGEFAAAADRYAAAWRAGRDRVEGATARVRALRARAAQAASRADVVAISEELDRLTSGGTRPGPEAAQLGRLLERLAQSDSGAVAGFRAAELARDSLRAAALAGTLFLEVATRYAESLFAPKAIVAAIPLTPARHDSLLGVLARDYAESPYVGALRGEISPAFAALEDSLARALGLAAPVATLVRSGVAPPVPGRPGPWWDVVFRAPAPLGAAARAGLGDDVEPGPTRPRPRVTPQQRDSVRP